MGTYKPTVCRYGGFIYNVDQGCQMYGERAQNGTRHSLLLQFLFISFARSASYLKNMYTHTHTHTHTHTRI